MVLDAEDPVDLSLAEPVRRGGGRDDELAHQLDLLVEGGVTQLVGGCLATGVDGGLVRA
jgi:hypothetical protein